MPQTEARIRKAAVLRNYLSGPRAIHFDRDEIRRVNGRTVKDGEAESSVSGTET